MTIKWREFATLDHQVAFQEGKAPAQLMVIHSNPFSGDQLDGFLRGQMWDCLEDRDRILSECHFQVAGHRPAYSGTARPGAGRTGYGLFGGPGPALSGL